MGSNLCVPIDGCACWTARGGDAGRGRVVGAHGISAHPILIGEGAVDGDGNAIGWRARGHPSCIGTAHHC